MPRWPGTGTASSQAGENPGSVHAKKMWEMHETAGRSVGISARKLGQYENVSDERMEVLI